MRNLSRQSLLLALTLAVLFAWGCGGGGSAGGDNSSDPGVAVDLIVQQTWPVNGQEVLPDLSDAGGPDPTDVDDDRPGQITIKFSEKVAQGSIIDKSNAYNGLTSNVNILDSAFARVQGNPNVPTDRKNVLKFAPWGDVLANGQYTITVSKDVLNFQGGRLNNGRFDHRSSFTVGTDNFAPVIRNTFPVPNQTEVPKNASITITFNESLNPATATGATITVVDGGTAPPTPIAGTLTTGRDDFEVVFTPDPVFPMPPNATIVVTVQGGASGVTDVVGNPFAGIPTGTDAYQFQFSTVTEPPDPVMPLPWDILVPEALVIVGTNEYVYGFDENPYINNSADLTQWGVGNPIVNSKRRVGRIGEMVMDFRSSPLDGHTWYYVVDQAARDVVIMGTRDNKMVYRWKNLPDPRGLAIQLSGRTLYATNFSNNSVSVLDIGRANIGDPVANDVTKSLSTPDGGVQAVEVGRGPMGAAHAPDGAVLFIANQLENTCTVINSSTLKVTTSFNIGTNPQDVAATYFFTGIGRFAYISCKGGGADEDGSVALYWSLNNSLQANITGFKNPQGLAYDYGLTAWVANSGGGSCAALTLAVVGGSFAATILPNITADVEVGDNPTDLVAEPFFTVLQLVPRSVIVTARGSGEVVFVDALQPSRPGFSIDLPGGPQRVTCLIDQ